MPLPINKPKLDSIVGTTLKTNSTQAITASDLQNSLYPIINSTFGLKTIWAGQLRSTKSAGGVQTVNFIENYYDPNYLPPVQEPGTNGSVVVNSVLNKYKITTLGSGLLADNLTPTGTFTNKPAVPPSTYNPNFYYGQGLTFDGYIEGGILKTLTVNNPGAGYSNYVFEDVQQSIPYTINVAGTGIRPVIEFNLANTIYPAQNYAQTGTNDQWNVFIPQVNQIFQYLNPIIRVADEDWGNSTAYNAPIFHLAYTMFAYRNSSNERPSYITNAMSSANTGYFTGGTINQNKPGFTFMRRNTSSEFKALGNLEIKVPILNTTYTPV